MRDFRWATFGLLALVPYAYLLQSVNRQQPDAYMDEPFHAGQTQRYCNGDWSTWDPKITTLPGLYLLAWGYVQLAGIMSGIPVVDLCRVTILRSLNCLLAPCCFWLLYQLHALLHRGNTDAASSAGVAVMLSLFPLHFFFSFLYYTDVGSTLFVLLCYWLTLKGSYAPAALAGVVAVLFRQTNAVWVTFTTAACMLRFCQAARRQQPSTKQPQRKDDSLHCTGPANEVLSAQTESRQSRGSNTSMFGEAHSDESIFEEVIAVLTVLWQELPAMLRLFWPLLLIPVGFVVFVVVNKGIVVGDRTAHGPMCHWAQPLYFTLFTSAAFAPSTFHITPALHSLRARPITTAASLLVTVAAALVAIHYGTLAHPYLLADNRHYTFYIWRKVLARHWIVKYALGPVYSVCATLMWGALGAGGSSKLWRLGFAGCVAATVVPAWLVEFRYFLVPVFLYALHIRSPSRLQLLLTCMGFVAVNVATLFLFLQRPFMWADSSVARFMW